jgi:hypothetical protein
MRTPMVVVHRSFRFPFHQGIDVGFGPGTQSLSVHRFVDRLRVLNGEKDAGQPNVPNAADWPASPGSGLHMDVARRTIETSRSASHRQRWSETGSWSRLL